MEMTSLTINGDLAMDADAPGQQCQYSDQDLGIRRWHAGAAIWPPYTLLDTSLVRSRLEQGVEEMKSLLNHGSGIRGTGLEQERILQGLKRELRALKILVKETEELRGDDQARADLAKRFSHGDVDPLRITKFRLAITQLLEATHQESPEKVITKKVKESLFWVKHYAGEITGDPEDHHLKTLTTLRDTFDTALRGSLSMGDYIDLRNLVCQAVVGLADSVFAPLLEESRECDEQHSPPKVDLTKDNKPAADVEFPNAGGSDQRLQKTVLDVLRPSLQSSSSSSASSSISNYESEVITESH